MSKRPTAANPKNANNKAKQPVKPKEQPAAAGDSKWKTWWIRTNFTVLMIGGFIFTIWLGHFALVALILFLQIFGYRELLKVRDTTSKSRSLSERSKFIDYFLLVIVQYFMYGLILFTQFPEIATFHPILSFLEQYHLMITFSLIAFLLVYFVLALEKDQYKRQFKLFGWSLCLLALIAPTNLQIYNIFQGIFWFIISASVVICNDIFAYVWGFSIGRTPLIQLSPKKTWEGFIGAIFSTLVFGYFFPLLLVNEHFACPRVSFWASTPCDLPYAFTAQEYPIPAIINDFLSQYFGVFWGSQKMYPVQVYSVIFAFFASTIAPFGGFLASGLKRGYGIKDFGDVIPGHGGIVDRMDCQVLMAGFTYAFYVTFVANHSLYVHDLLSQIHTLEPHYQIEIYQKLHATLLAQNLI